MKRLDELLKLQECETVELKAAEILRKPSDVAREVIGMLNGLDKKKQGVIWVGVEERGGHVIGVAGVPEAHIAHARLRDHLVDTIEPRPSESEVHVKVESVDNGSQVLLVEVSPRLDHRPYAALLQGGRYYWRRMQDRLSPMNYHELDRAWKERGMSRPNPKEFDPFEWLATQRDEIRKSGRAVLWIAACTTEEVEFPCDTADFGRFLVDPALSGNRAHGWTFLRRGNTPQPELSGLRVVGTDESELRVLSQGRLTMRVPLTALQYERDRDKEIYPYALLEYPTSVARLIGALTSKYDAEGKRDVMFQLGLQGVRGWALWPYSPRSLEWHDEVFVKRLLTVDPVFDETDDLPIPPLQFEWSEITSEPDRCANRAIQQVYRAFHYTDSEIPREFNTKTGRLDLG